MQTVKSGFPPDVVEAHLERVLASEPFRTSQRSQEFLRFVVARVLEGDADSIKERNIAVEVFHRSPAYNSSEDSFVRVKASEVRRRLAAYYASAPPGDTLRFELPLGGYVPVFAPIEPPRPDAASPAPPPAGPRRPKVLIALAACAAIAALAFLAASWRRSTPLDDFWAPILESSEPVVIFLPVPVSYVIVTEEAARATGEPLLEIIPSPADSRRFLAATAQKVGLGAAQGAMRFAALCARTGKAYTTKFGSDFSFADLRDHPAILFGAFSSQWTVEINNEYRFKLFSSPYNHVLDSRNPSRQWRAVLGPQPGNPLEDYALASRVINSKSGRLVILAAGISTFGTQAAAEFLTDPQRLQELTRRAPAPLSRGNFQVLLHTKVIGNTPTPARIVDVHFW